MAHRIDWNLRQHRFDICGAHQRHIAGNDQHRLATRPLQLETGEIDGAGLAVFRVLADYLRSR